MQTQQNSTPKNKFNQDKFLKYLDDKKNKSKNIGILYI